MNSYQKLKKENEKIKKELDALVNDPDSAFSLLVKMKYKLIRQTEEAIMFGNPTPSNNFYSRITT